MKDLTNILKKTQILQRKLDFSFEKHNFMTDIHMSDHVQPCPQNHLQG